MLAARSDRDFAAVAPVRKKQPRKKPVPWPRRMACVLLRHPGAVVTALVVAGAGSAIAVNALAYQPGGHPAPLFGHKGKEQRRAAAPLPPTRPVAVTASLAPTAAPAVDRDGTEAARPADPAAALPRAAPQPPARTAGIRDPIADLIKSNESGSAASAPARIEAVQRALSKLGYGPLKPDGLMGPDTRAAIEHFERDRRLPVTGEPNARTVRDLATQARIAIE